MPAVPYQQELVFRAWGGRRRGAGRPPGRRPNAAHRARELHNPRHPVHVTLRARGAVALRTRHVFPAVRDALRAATKDGFRVIAFSVQADHVHLVVEADTTQGFRRGLQGLAIRVAKAVNRICHRRGRVWTDRYHARALTSPRAVRHAFVYVLQNFRKHVPGARGIDPYSSAAWFSGWRQRVPVGTGPPPVAAPVTWLARIGWHRHGRIDLREKPIARRRR